MASRSTPMGVDDLDVAGGQRIEVGPTPDFNFGTRDFVIDFWILCTSAHLCHPFCWYYDDDNYCTLYAVQHSGSTVRLRFKLVVAGATKIDVDTGATLVTIADGTYWHVAVERNGVNTHIYVDGTKKGTDTAAAVITVNLSSWTLRIGESWIPELLEFGRTSGSFDEFRIHRDSPYKGVNFTPPTAPYAHPISRTFDDCSVIRNPFSRTFDDAYGLGVRSVSRVADDAFVMLTEINRRFDDAARIYIALSTSHDDAQGLAMRSVSRTADDAYMIRNAYSRVFDEAFGIHGTGPISRVFDDAQILRVAVSRIADDAVIARIGVSRTFDDGFRIEDTTLAGYELYYAMDAEPDLEGAPVATSPTLPFDSPVISGAGLHNFVVRRRNMYGLITENVKYFTIELDAGGNELVPVPSDPESIYESLVDFDAHQIRVRARYTYPKDGTRQADTWILYWEESLESSPWPDPPSSPSSTEIAMVKDDGIAKLDYVLTLTAIPQFFTVGVRTKRSGDSRESANALVLQGGYSSPAGTGLDVELL